MFPVEFLTNNLKRYYDARQFRDLDMIVEISLVIISLIAGHVKLCINGIAGEVVLYMKCPPGPFVE